MNTPPTPYSVLAESPRFCNLFAAIDKKLNEHAPNVFRCDFNVNEHFEQVRDTTLITPDFCYSVAHAYSALGWSVGVESGPPGNYTLRFHI